MWSCRPKQAMTFSFLMLLITHHDALQSVGLLSTSDQLSQSYVTYNDAKIVSCFCRVACESCGYPLSITVPSLPTYTISVRSQFNHGPQVVKKFELLCLSAKSHFVQTYETAVTPTVNTIFIVATCISYSHLTFSRRNYFF